MMTSKEYADIAFKAANKGEAYNFNGGKISFCKGEDGYLLDIIYNEDDAESPIRIDSKEQLAEEILHLIPCEECSLENKEFSWDENVEEMDKEDIKWKFIEKLRCPDGHEYVWERNEFYDDVQVNGRTYSCSVYCEIATTGYWYYGDTVSVKRVR